MIATDTFSRLRKDTSSYMIPDEHLVPVHRIVRICGILKFDYFCSPGSVFEKFLSSLHERICRSCADRAGRVHAWAAGKSVHTNEVVPEVIRDARSTLSSANAGMQDAQLMLFLLYAHLNAERFTFLGAIIVPTDFDGHLHFAYCFV